MDIKKIIFAGVALMLMYTISSAQNFKINRYYGDIGFHVGNTNTFKNYYPHVHNNTGSGTYTPEGLYASITTASDKYLIRIRGSFFAGEHGNALGYEISLLAGINFRKKYFAVDVAAGIGYYYVTPSYFPRTNEKSYNFRLPGISFEANFTVTPFGFFAISPVIFGGVTTKSFSLAAGIKLGFGKYRN